MLTGERFTFLVSRYAQLRIAVVGDFCLDRYLEIDPQRTERSLETGRQVHNVRRVRSQAGGAGTIVNNLAALGVGDIHVVGFAGRDGEGYELCQALARLPGVRGRHFFRTRRRCTFTYCKPLLLHPDRPPEELDRLDQKNWTPTPAAVQARIRASLLDLAPQLDALILLEQVELAGTGVLTPRVLRTVAALAQRRPELLILADSRRGLLDYPPVCFKMNRTELAKLIGAPLLSREDIRQAVSAVARRNGRPVFVTLAEEGILAATPAGDWYHAPALPCRGPIDIVGAGDAVTANLACALAAGATLPEALQLANAAASVVIHQLGTTGTATPAQLREVSGIT